MFHCYVLRSEKTGRHYAGSCKNLSERFRRHNAGDSKATKHGVPWLLIHIEAFGSRSERHNARDISKLDEVEVISKN